MSVSLIQRYGKHKSYTVGQVKTTIEILKLSSKHTDLAVYVFCNADDKDKYEFKLEEIKRFRSYGDGQDTLGGQGVCGNSFGEGSCGGGGD